MNSRLVRRPTQTVRSQYRPRLRLATVEAVDDEEFDRIREEIRRLDAELKAAPGWVLLQDRNSLDDTIRVFRGNHWELSQALAVGRDPHKWLPLMAQTNDEGFWKFMDELDRLLHNYLASAFSLSSCMWEIKRSRGWPSKAEGLEFERRSPYKRPGPTSFMFALRHAAQHQRIPMTSGGIRGWRDEKSGRLESEAYFFLVLADLRRLNWKRAPEGRAYLDALSEDPRLDTLVDVFTDELIAFAMWFRTYFQHVYRQEFEQLERLNLQRNKVGKPVFDLWAKIRS